MGVWEGEVREATEMRRTWKELKNKAMNKEKWKELIIIIMA